MGEGNLSPERFSFPSPISPRPSPRASTARGDFPDQQVVVGKNGTIGREQLAPPGHEGGALADAEVFEQLFHILDLVAGGFREPVPLAGAGPSRWVFQKAEADPLLSLFYANMPRNGDIRVRRFAPKGKSLHRKGRIVTERRTGPLDPCPAFT